MHLLAHFPSVFFFLVLSEFLLTGYPGMSKKNIVSHFFPFKGPHSEFSRHLKGMEIAHFAAELDVYLCLTLIPLSLVMH